eukprot:2037603-Alexandrium_andersonii.AAC.1
MCAEAAPRDTADTNAALALQRQMPPGPPVRAASNPSCGSPDGSAVAASSNGLSKTWLWE